MTPTDTLQAVNIAVPVWMDNGTARMFRNQLEYVYTPHVLSNAALVVVSHLIVNGWHVHIAPHRSQGLAVSCRKADSSTGVRHDAPGR
jgi:hypothetical protein